MAARINAGAIGKMQADFVLLIEGEPLADPGTVGVLVLRGWVICYLALIIIINVLLG
jgi:hypothetical protein